MIAYHVTLKKNLSSILSEGLKPMIGPRSQKLEQTSAIFLFPSRDHVDDALMNWLGDELEDEELVLLEVDLKNLNFESNVDSYEIIVLDLISPDRIQNLGPL